jgi:hypothetical protein
MDGPKPARELADGVRIRLYVRRRTTAATNRDYKHHKWMTEVDLGNEEEITVDANHGYQIVEKDESAIFLEERTDDGVYLLCAHFLCF